MTDARNFDVLDLIKEVAETVIRPRFRALVGDDVEEKQPGDFVTIADRESEIEITTGLEAAYPGVLVIGEEAVFTDPKRLDALPAAEHAFVVDPVDGTRNFVHGSPDYAVMVGELVRGEAVRGWIWQPEHQRAFVTERGAGVTLNDERMSAVTREERPLVQSARKGLVGRESEALRAPVENTRFCCGIDYPGLLLGELDALIYGRPNPWDHVPGSLMVSELGGATKFPDGADYAVGVEAKRLLVLGEPRLFEPVAALLS